MNRTYRAILAGSILLSTAAVAPLSAMDDNQHAEEEVVRSPLVTQLRQVLSSETILEDVQAVFRCDEEQAEYAITRIREFLADETLEVFQSRNILRIMALCTEQEISTIVQTLIDLCQITDESIDTIGERLASLPAVGEALSQYIAPYLYLGRLYLRAYPRQDQPFRERILGALRSIDMSALFAIIIRNAPGDGDGDRLNVPQLRLEDIEGLLRSLLHENLDRITDGVNSELHELPNRPYHVLALLHLGVHIAELYFNREQMIPVLQNLAGSIEPLEIEDSQKQETADTLASFALTGNINTLPQTARRLVELNPQFQGPVREVALQYADQQHERANQIADAVSHPMEIRYREYKNTLTFFAGMMTLIFIQQMYNALI